MCVIIYTTINNKKILVKNRDRVYKPNIVIIHELVDGVEMAYIKDLKTGWIEGLNGNGIGIINSTLNRNDGKHKVDKSYLKMKKNRILDALHKTDVKKIINEIVEDTKKIPFLEGHSLIVCDDKCLHIENNVDNKFVISKINETSVFTNSGKSFNEAGWIKGKKGLSSFLRRKNIEMELKNNKINSYDDLISIMNKNYIGIDPRFHSYRDEKMIEKHLNKTFGKNKNNKAIVRTTGQILLNLTDKELVYYEDINNSKSVKYINKLPKNYNPIIKIIINKTEKNTIPTKSKLSQKYLKKLYKKFNFNNETKRKPKNINKLTHNKTKRNKIKKL
jgi:hypothetical protein